MVRICGIWAWSFLRIVWRVLLGEVAGLRGSAYSGSPDTNADLWNRLRMPFFSTNEQSDPTLLLSLHTTKKLLVFSPNV